MITQQQAHEMVQQLNLRTGTWVRITYLTGKRVEGKVDGLFITPMGEPFSVTLTPDEGHSHWSRLVVPWTSIESIESGDRRPESGDR